MDNILKNRSKKRVLKVFFILFIICLLILLGLFLYIKNTNNKDTNINIKPVLFTKLKHNENKKTRVQIYNSPNNPKCIVKYDYDNKGNLIKRLQYFKENEQSEEKLENQTLYEYDQNNNLVKTILNKEIDNDNEEKIFKYENNLLKELYQYGYNEETKTSNYDKYEKEIFYYNNNQLLASKEWYSVDEQNQSKLEGKYIYKYDNNNKLIEEKFLNSDKDSSLLTLKTFEYQNDKLIRIKQTCYDPQTLEIAKNFEYYFEYDNNKLIKKIKHDVLEKDKFVYTYSY